MKNKVTVITLLIAGFGVIFLYLSLVLKEHQTTSNFLEVIGSTVLVSATIALISEYFLKDELVQLIIDKVQIKNNFTNSGVTDLFTSAISLQEKYGDLFRKSNLSEIDIVHSWGETWLENNRDNIRSIAKKKIKMRVVLLNYDSLYVEPLAYTLKNKPEDVVSAIKRSIASWNRLILEFKKSTTNKIEIEVYLTNNIPTNSIYRFGNIIISADRNSNGTKSAQLNIIICEKVRNGFYNNLKSEIEELIENSERVAIPTTV